MTKIKEIKIDELKGIMCAWSGCQETIPLGDTLPEGWKVLVVSKGSLFNPENLLHADVDGILCPRHYRELLSLLKVGENEKEEQHEEEA